MTGKFARRKALHREQKCSRHAPVLSFVAKARVQSAACRSVSRANENLTESFRPLPVITELVSNAFQSRDEPVAEDMAARQQTARGRRDGGMMKVISTGGMNRQRAR